MKSRPTASRNKTTTAFPSGPTFRYPVGRVCCRSSRCRTRRIYATGFPRLVDRRLPSLHPPAGRGSPRLHLMAAHSRPLARPRAEESGTGPAARGAKSPALTTPVLSRPSRPWDSPRPWARLRSRLPVRTHIACVRARRPKVQLSTAPRLCLTRAVHPRARPRPMATPRWVARGEGGGNSARLSPLIGAAPEGQAA